MEISRPEGGLDDVITSIVAIIAARGADAVLTGGRSAYGALVGLVRRRFGDRTREDAVLRAVIDEPEDGDRQAELARVLDVIRSQDPDFDRALRWHWRQARAELAVEADGPVNHFSGSAGNLVQARDIHGDITF